MKKIFYISLFVISVYSENDRYVNILFQDSVVINDAVIRLCDVAHISGVNNVALEMKLKNTVLGNTAPPGMSRFMTVNDAVCYSLKPLFENLHIRVNGAKRVCISTESTVRNVEDYEEHILNYLNDNIGWEKGSYKITIVNREKKWRCYKKPFNVSIDGLVSPFPKGNTNIKIKITQENYKCVIPVLCKISVVHSVLCVAETIERNAVIQKYQVVVRDVDITNYRYGIYTDIDQVIGKVATKILSVGTIINKRCIKNIPDICKGDEVFIKLTTGAIRISIPARARENGVIGEKIWVENMKSHKIIQAKIIDKGIVKI